MAKDILLGRTNRDWSIGSIVLPEKQEKRLLAKADEVRYDVRRAAGKVSAGLLVLSAAAGFLGITVLARKI